jgi:hypothetical protein
VIPFRLGQIVATPGALEALNEAMDTPITFLQRHAANDWGVVCDEDKALNDEALELDNRVLSAYDLINGTRIWIITEADRSVTTILLPEEY